MSKPTYIAAIDIGTQYITGAIAQKNENKTIQILAFEKVATRPNSVVQGRVKDVNLVLFDITSICKKLANQCQFTPKKIYIYSSWLNRESTYAEWDKLIETAGTKSKEPLQFIPINRLLTTKADLYMTPAEQNNGCLFIDMGAGTTSYIMRMKGQEDQMGMIPSGGYLISNDLTFKGLTFDYAEKLKIKLGSAQVSKLEFPNKYISLKPEGPFDINQSISLQDLAQMIEDRVNDTARRFLAPLIKDGNLSSAGCKIVISGGGSKLKNIDAWYSDKTHLEVRRADATHFINNDELSLFCNKPQNHTLLSMLVLGNENCLEEKKSIFNRINKLAKPKNINTILDTGIGKLFD